VHEGVALPEQISAEDIQDDRFLKPVLDDDALILCLDDLPEVSSAAATQAQGLPQGGADAGLVDSLLQKNADLQAELDQLAKQFNNYRLAVQQTLDQRWGDDDEGPGPADKAGASSSGSAGGNTGKESKDGYEYYFESYAHNGGYSRRHALAPETALICENRHSRDYAQGCCPHGCLP
jgi:type I protein arginine methyltransferase